MFFRIEIFSKLQHSTAQHIAGSDQLAVLHLVKINSQTEWEDLVRIHFSDKDRQTTDDNPGF